MSGDAETPTPAESTVLGMPTRVFGSLLGFVVVLIIVIVLVVHAATKSNAPTLDPQQLDSQMETYLGGLGANRAVVDCPSGQKIKTNSVFLCTVTNAQGVNYMKVTVLNSKGDIQFQATS